jgi:pyruvate decarboxylase
VPVSTLDKKLVHSLPVGDLAVETRAISNIIAKLEASNGAAIIVDGGANRSSWAPFVDPLVDALKVPVFVTCLGKGAVDESSPYFGGAYGGIDSWPNVAKMVESSDCILWLGRLPSDFNTYVRLIVITIEILLMSFFYFFLAVELLQNMSILLLSLTFNASRLR